MTTQNVSWMIAISLFLFGLYFLLRGEGHAAVNQKEFYDQWATYYHQGQMNPGDCREKIEFHQKEAKRLYQEIKDRCWWLPCLDDRKKARKLFNLITPVVAASGITGKVVGTLVVGLGDYCLDCMDEWNYIENKLHWLEYHTEQAEFYENYLLFEARCVAKIKTVS